MVCLAPRAPEDSVRPRRLSGVVVRPLNFTVRLRMPRTATTLATLVLLVSSQALKCSSHCPRCGPTWFLPSIRGSLSRNGASV
jgi:hypothetical protein